MATIHPIQEHVNTLGIDWSIQRLTEYIYEYERNSFPAQSVRVKCIVVFVMFPMTAQLHP